MLTQLVVWLNAAAGGIANVMLAPVAWMPGWLSATLIAVVTGVLMLLAFKYTSNQVAIKRTRNGIKSNLLALSLFKDSVAVSLRAQGGILTGALRLMVLAIVPILVMVVPMSLLLGQMALWYQARPLHVGEEAVVTVHLKEDASAVSEIALESSSAITTVVGPVRVPSKDMVCFSIQASEAGCHRLSFAVGGESFTKELAVGDGYMPTSLMRPAWNWSEALLHPREAPFSSDSAVQSIEVAYPERASWTSGTDWWLVYWFAVSMVAAFIARPILKVNI
jgi:uncharacterized membrane protein (DUF106 family)